MTKNECYSTIRSTYLAYLLDMPLLGYNNTKSGDVQLEVFAASKNCSPPASKFSKTSYKAMSWGDNLAKQLHESRYLYAAYGALDGLSNICSHWRFLFDIIYFTSETSSDDKLHEFLSSTEGMSFVGIETLIVMIYASVANYVGKGDKNRPFGRFLSSTWPYLRDCFKASKNTFKAIRATLNILSFLSGKSLLPYVVPTTIVVSIFAIADRLLMRYMYAQRKKMMLNNKQIWLKIQKLNATKIKASQLANLDNITLDKLQQQSQITRTLAFLGAAFGGFVDGLYLYLGVVTILGVTGLIWLTAPVALFLISCCVLFSLTNIAVRVYEEFDYQKQLDISVAKAQLSLIGKKIEYLYYSLGLEQEEDLDETQKGLDQLYLYVDEFVRQRKVLKNLNCLSYRSAFLLGISHGLAAYGALASLLFAATTITFLAIQTIPIVLVVAAAVTIASGLLLMALFSANAVYRTYQHRRKVAAQEKTRTPISSLEDFKNWITPKEEEGYSKHTYKDLKREIDDGMVMDDQPLFLYMELFEVIRSFFSGVGKGPKSVLTTFNVLQEKGEDGIYHIKSGILFSFTTLSSLVYSVCLALRAYAKGFGTRPIDKIQKPGKRTPSSFDKPVLNNSALNISMKRGKCSEIGVFSGNRQKNSSTSSEFFKSKSRLELVNKNSL